MQLKLTLIFLFAFLILRGGIYAQGSDTLVLKRPKIGLVLSGGGANGFAHIGVLKVLEEHGIKPDYITGTSMGSIVGALYALGYSSNQLEEIIKTIDWNDVLTDQISIRDIPIFDKQDYPGYSVKMNITNGIKPSLPAGMIQGQKAQKLFARLTWESHQYSNFDAFPIPFRCVAVDIISGKAVVFKDGDLAEAMRASMSIPTVFSPVEKDDLLLIDGGVIRNFPVQECLDMGADIIIGVYTGFSENPDKDDLQSMVKILARSTAFQGIILAKEEAKLTDVYIVPDLTNFGPEHFNKSKGIILQGETAARDSLVMKKLNQISTLCLANDSIKPLKDHGKLWINKIQVKGCELSDSKTIINISELKNQSYMTADDIDKAINRVYSTWQFKKVTYSINHTLIGRDLIITVKEKSRAYLNLGLHYDNSYGPNALVKIGYNNLLLKSTKAELKFSVSQNPRALFSYKFFPTKRRQLEISLNTYMQLSKMPDIIKEENLVYTLGHYVYTLVDFDLSFSWSPFKNTMLQARVGNQLNNIVLKEGMEIYYNTNTVNYNFSFYDFRIYINSLNDKYFPTKGICFDARYKYNFNIITNQSDTSYLNKKQTDNNMILTFKYQQYILIAKKFSLIPAISFGTMSEEAFITEKFFLGGINYSLRPNTYNFGGIRSNYIATDNFFMIGIGGQYKLLNNWYLQLGVQNLFIADYADYESEEEDGEENNDDVFNDNSFFSWRAGIGYQSKFGPIRFVLSKSPERKEFVWSMNIGIPF